MVERLMLAALLAAWSGEVHADARLPYVYVYRVDAAGTFDVTAWRGRKGVAYRISAHAGVLESAQPGGSPY